MNNDPFYVWPVSSVSYSVVLITQMTWVRLRGYFTFLCNLSIETGQVPADWKQAIVIRIPKIFNSRKVSDLRPISLLPTPGKVLEHIIYNRLMTYLETTKRLTQRHFGFHPGLSTVDAISNLIDDIGFNLNNNQLTLATFISFSKAFDTSNHDLILKETNLP